MSAIDALTRRSAERALTRLTGRLATDPERCLDRLAGIVQTFATADDQKRLISDVRQYLQSARGADPKPMPMQILRRAIDATSSRCQIRLATNLLMWTRQGWPKRSEAEKAGFCAPFVLLISPTMRCNLRCTGCYAAEYDRKADLPTEVIERVIVESKALGIYAVTVLGGEPFVREELLDIFDRHPDMTFQVFTNGTLVTDDVAARLAEAGNVLVSFSVDGFQPAHDARRGHGTLRRVERGMAALRAVGVPFGFSTMVTSETCHLVTSDAFVDHQIDQGCLWGWHFLYMPVGRDPDLHLMPTPEQREDLRVNGAARIRETKPIFVMDFWNDAPHVGGCIGGGREYLHINSDGDVEPCIFTHFATDNIKEKSLREVLESPFFRAIRERQPYSDNLLRPCMLIDNADVVRDVVSRTGARPTHPGAEELLTSLAGPLDAYGAQYKEIADRAWAEKSRSRSLEGDH